MTYFKLDIPKVNESISRYKETKKICLDDINIVYRGLGYTESAWNDPNAYTFIEKTKRDKYKLNEYFNYLDNLYNEINQFKLNIDSLCSKQGYRTNTVLLKFDDNDIEICKRSLNKVINYLNDSLNRIDINDFEITFEYRNLVYNLRNEIKVIKNSINQLIQDISSFVNSINNEIDDSKFRLKRISRYNFDLKVTDYKWKVTNIDTKMINVNNIENYSNVSNQKIQNDISGDNYNLSKNIANYNANVNKIDADETEKVEGLNKNLFTTFNNQSNIDLEESQKVEGLNKNLFTSFTKQNNINLEEATNIKNLDDNINSVSVKDNKINTNVFSETKELDNNLNQFDINDNKISLDLSKDFTSLDREIESVKASNNSINYNVGDAVNVSRNVFEAKVNQANIDTSNVVSSNYNLSSGIDIAEVKTTGIATDINQNVNLDTNIKKMENLNENQ